jgi:signal recognition particle receptor subunit beta
VRPELSFINYSSREVSCKVVYCGPGLSGKTTNIVQLFRSTRPELRGRLITLDTWLERTLYFDFLPLEIGRISGFKVRFHLYTVPGQVFYAASRRLIFRGADGIVFVADSNPERMDANYEAQRDLRKNLLHYGFDIRFFPYVLQLNKRDLANCHETGFLSRELRLASERVFEAVAIRNQGVQETVKEVIRQVLGNLRKELGDDLGASRR